MPLCERIVHAPLPFLPPRFQVGKKRPKYPKTSSILDSSVNEQDQGMAVDWFHGIVIPFFGYRRKNAPTRPISAELLTVTQYFACTRCSPNRDREVQYKIPTVRRCIYRRETGASFTDEDFSLTYNKTYTVPYPRRDHSACIYRLFLSDQSWVVTVGDG